MYNELGDDMRNISKQLNKINKLIKVQGAMPGHKGKIKINPSHDLTELSGLDNLQNPTGAIKKAEDRAAVIYGVEYARYLVNGSSGGNLTLIFSFFKEGEKIIVERNCHKSVFNGILLRKLKPVYLWPQLDRWGNALPQSSQTVEEALREHPDSKGVLLTLPSYKGLVSDYKAVYQVTQRRDVKLIVDGAHGAALAGLKEFQGFYQSCDAMVISAHKSLACLNQGALILGNCREDQPIVIKYSNMFQTSSPSYLIMESMEASVEELAQGAYLDPPDFNKENYERLCLNPLNEELLQDPWKLLLYAQDKGRFMDAFLEAKGIFAEMHDRDSLLLMLSPKNGLADIHSIKIALKELDKALVQEVETEDDWEASYTGHALINRALKPDQRFLPWQVGDEFKELSLQEAIGSTAQEQVIPYPPGIPLLQPGERIDEEMVEHIETLLEQNIEIIGLTDHKVRCIKEEL